MCCCCCCCCRSSLLIVWLANGFLFLTYFLKSEVSLEKLINIFFSILKKITIVFSFRMFLCWCSLQISSIVCVCVCATVTCLYVLDVWEKVLSPQNSNSKLYLVWFFFCQKGTEVCDSIEQCRRSNGTIQFGFTKNWILVSLVFIFLNWRSDCKPYINLSNRKLSDKRQIWRGTKFRCLGLLLTWSVNLAFALMYLFLVKLQL